MNDRIEPGHGPIDALFEGEPEVLFRKDICRIYRMSPVTLWRRLKSKTDAFPHPVDIGGREGWLRSALLQHEKAKMEAGHANAA